MEKVEFPEGLQEESLCALSIHHSQSAFIL